MPQIPLYKQNVAPTSQGTGAQLSVEAAVAPWREATKLGLTIAGEMKDYQASRKRYQEINERLEVEKLKAEDTLLKLDIKNRIGIARNVYESGLQTRTDYRNFGTDGDKELGVYNKTVNDLISDPRLKDHPQLAQELKIHAYGEYANAQIDANTIGARELHAQTKSVVDVTVEERIRVGDAEGAINIIEASPVHTDAEKAKKLIEIPRSIQSNKINELMSMNPQKTIDLLQEQLSGKETHFDAMSEQDLRSKKAYAKQILSERQIKASEELNLPESKYNKMEPDQKFATLKDMHESGAISDKTYKTEYDLILEPHAIKTTPAHISSFLEYQRKMYEAGQDKEKLAQILSNSNGEILPRYMKNDLFELAKGLQDPSSMYNRAPIAYMHTQLDEAFKREDVLPNFSSWDFIKKPISKLGFDTGYVADWDEYADAINARAKYEIQTNMDKWIKSQKEFPGPSDISRKLADEVLRTKEKYGTTAVNKYIRELYEAETKQIAPDDDIINEAMNVNP